MVTTPCSDAGRRSPSARSTIVMALAAALAIALCNAALAQGCPDTPAASAAQGRADSKLENAFWACDRATATLPYDRDTAITCSVVYEKLKAQKFNGDFCQLLAWWRQSKPPARQAPTRLM